MVFGFDRIFVGFSVLDDSFYSFAVSNGPQCPPPLGKSGSPLIKVTLTEL